MLRLKLQEGGEVNIPIYKVLAFIGYKDGSQVVVDGGLAYSVKESCQTIRGQFKKLKEETEV